MKKDDRDSKVYYTVGYLKSTLISDYWTDSEKLEKSVQALKELYEFVGWDWEE